MIKPPTTLIDMLEQQVQRRPETPLFSYLADGEREEDRVTTGALAERTQVIGQFLQQHGLSDRRALLIYRPGIDYIAAFFGCLYAGVTPIPIYPPRANQRLSRIQNIIANAGSTLALTNTDILQSIQRVVAQNPAMHDLVWVTTDDLRDLPAGPWVPAAANADAPAFFQYTSGSTGVPKGVVVTHSNLLHNLATFRRRAQITPDSRAVSWLPQYHDMGLIGIVLAAVYTGVPTLLMSPTAFLQRPVRWLQLISEHRITHSGGPNFGYELCARKITPEQLAGLDLSSWEVAFSGAEPIRPATLEAFAATFAPCGFRKNSLLMAYGLAEATLMVAATHKNTPPHYLHLNSHALHTGRVVPVAPGKAGCQTLVSCGFGATDQQIVIVHPEQHTPCAPDEVGEIWVAGPSIAAGYWNSPEATAHTFQARLVGSDAGPFLRTGDLGFLHEQQLFVTGRLKDLIIIAGRNQYPQDIEHSVENCHPALSLAGAAFSVEVEGAERLVVAHELERHYHKWSRAEIIAAVRRTVAEQHELQVYDVALVKPGRLPKTSSGKVQRSATRAAYLAGELDRWEEA